ncbi:MAG TPA: BrnT family toxin [Bryobacteraceae bacterium]|nr:BrnT family toxin [Bryobacteraceae bacterium]
MEYEWSAAKQLINVRKHGVRFADAVQVFEDPCAITITDDGSAEDEQRFVTIGIDALARVLVVVYTYRGENIRLISAREAEAHERKEYGDP